MKKSDWIGIMTSLFVHALMVLGFASLMAAKPEPIALGFIEVEFGPFLEGRPVQRSEANMPEATEQEEMVEEEHEQPAETQKPEEARPVDLPDQDIDVPDEEQIEAPQTETIAPETRDDQQSIEEEEPEQEEVAQPIRPLGSGADDGNTGAADGADGEGADEQESAPFQIEGLNRIPTFTPTPVYVEKVNAVIRIRITVDPRGRIVSRFPLQKGNPALEQAVMTALQRWSFNPLPPNAPQENQIGIVTFRFRLE